MTQYMKYKQLEWVEGDEVDYDGLKEKTFTCYVPALDANYNICESEGRFYPIWNTFPAEGYASLEEAKRAGQLHYEDRAEEIILALVEQVGVL